MQVIEIKGKYNKAVVHTEMIEPEAHNQIQRLCNQEFVKDEKIVTHINFSKILLNDNNFNYKNIYLNDGIHLNRDNHANLFMKKILDELSKYLL